MTRTELLFSSSRTEMSNSNHVENRRRTRNANRNKFVFLFQKQLNFYIRHLRERFKISGNHFSPSFAFLMETLENHLPPPASVLLKRSDTGNGNKSNQLACCGLSMASFSNENATQHGKTSRPQQRN